MAATPATPPPVSAVAVGAVPRSNPRVSLTGLQQQFDCLQQDWAKLKGNDRPRPQSRIDLRVELRLPGPGVLLPPTLPPLDHPATSAAAAAAAVAPDPTSARSQRSSSGPTVNQTPTPPSKSSCSGSVAVTPALRLSSVAEDGRPSLSSPAARAGPGVSGGNGVTGVNRDSRSKSTPRSLNHGNGVVRQMQQVPAAAGSGSGRPTPTQQQPTPSAAARLTSNGSTTAGTPPSAQAAAASPAPSNRATSVGKPRSQSRPKESKPKQQRGWVDVGPSLLRPLTPMLGEGFAAANLPGGGALPSTANAMNNDEVPVAAAVTARSQAPTRQRQRSPPSITVTPPPCTAPDGGTAGSVAAGSVQPEHAAGSHSPLRGGHTRIPLTPTGGSGGHSGVGDSNGYSSSFNDTAGSNRSRIPRSIFVDSVASDNAAGLMGMKQRYNSSDASAAGHDTVEKPADAAPALTAAKAAVRKQWAAPIPPPPAVVADTRPSDSGSISTQEVSPGLPMPPHEPFGSVLLVGTQPSLPPQQPPAASGPGQVQGQGHQSRDHSDSLLIAAARRRSSTGGSAARGACMPDGSSSAATSRAATPPAEPRPAVGKTGSPRQARLLAVAAAGATGNGAMVRAGSGGGAASGGGAGTGSSSDALQEGAATQHLQVDALPPTSSTKAGWRHADGTVAQSVDQHQLPWTEQSASAATTTADPSLGALAVAVAAAAAASKVSAISNDGSKQGNKDHAGYMRKLSALKRMNPSQEGNRRASDTNLPLFAPLAAVPPLPIPEERAASFTDAPVRTLSGGGSGSRKWMEPAVGDAPLAQFGRGADGAIPRPISGSEGGSGGNGSVPTAPGDVQRQTYDVTAARASLIANLIKSRSQRQTSSSGSSLQDPSTAIPLPASTSHAAPSSITHSHMPSANNQISDHHAGQSHKDKGTPAVSEPVPGMSVQLMRSRDSSPPPTGRTLRRSSAGQVADLLTEPQSPPPPPPAEHTTSFSTIFSPTQADSNGSTPHLAPPYSTSPGQNEAWQQQQQPVQFDGGNGIAPFSGGRPVTPMDAAFMAYAVQNPGMAVAAAAVALDASSRRERARWQAPPPPPVSALQEMPVPPGSSHVGPLNGSIGESWDASMLGSSAVQDGLNSGRYMEYAGANVWQASVNSDTWQAAAQSYHNHQQQQPPQVQQSQQHYRAPSMGQYTPPPFHNSPPPPGRFDQRPYHLHIDADPDIRRTNSDISPSGGAGFNAMHGHAAFARATTEERMHALGLGPPPPQVQQQQQPGQYQHNQPQPPFWFQQQQQQQPQQQQPAPNGWRPAEFSAWRPPGFEQGPPAAYGAPMQGGQQQQQQQQQRHPDYHPPAAWQPAPPQAQAGGNPHWDNNHNGSPLVHPRNQSGEAAALMNGDAPPPAYRNAFQTPPPPVRRTSAGQPAHEPSPDLPAYLRQSRSKLTTGWSASPHEAQSGALSAFADVYVQKYGGPRADFPNGQNQPGQQYQGGGRSYNPNYQPQPQSMAFAMHPAANYPPTQTLHVPLAARPREDFNGLSLAEVLASKAKPSVPNFKKKGPTSGNGQAIVAGQS